MMRRIVFCMGVLMACLSAACLSVSVPAFADAMQTDGSQCVRKADGLSWAEDTPVRLTAKTVDAADGVKMALGKQTHLRFHRQTDVTFATLPGSATETMEDGFAGMAVFDVPEDGSYAVSARGMVWIDLVQRGQLIDSSGHERGPACEGKTVYFPLKAGRAIIQLSGAGLDAIDVLVTRGAPPE
ncbi:hypothetical protein FHS78_002910 [Parvibaculum indicum]|uniref:hypothetical protein n=1 Tax=Parvibaculum indicum TaxID=562969 RepID=UPI00142022EE|nr:hypothetical protein [Parvibaculum indicum]NIJ42608.1 hypothetical protein [Parvibaculum indicum]